jgi:hypothetical protein
MKAIMKQIIYFTIAVLLLSACNTNNGIYWGKTTVLQYDKPAQKLVGELYDIESLGFGKVEVKGDYLLVFPNRPDAATLLTICDKKTGRILLKNAITQGRGANEYLWLDFISFEEDTSGVKAWFQANGVEKMICFNVTKSVIQGKTVIDREIRTGEMMVNDVLSVRFSDPNNLLYLKIFAEQECFKLLRSTIKTSVTDTLGSIYRKPVFFMDVSATEVYNPKYPFYVFGMVFLNTIYFYSLDNPNHSFSVCVCGDVVDYDVVKTTDQRQSAGRETYYGSAFGTDDFVCFLYNKGECNFLHILDWNGNLKNVFELDKPVNYITYDEPQKTIYAVQWNEETIYKYKLPY